MAIDSDFENDELRIYRGLDFKLCKYITIHQATLGEICDYGEIQYFSIVNHIIATPQSMKAQLWKSDIDFTTITPYQLFLLSYKSFSPENTKLIFGNFDFTQLILKKDEEENIYLGYENNPDVVINESIYDRMVNYLCKSHMIERDLKEPMNETTKMILIEDALESLNSKDDKSYHSILKNLISAMINSPGFKYNHEQVWTMKINAFMDSVKRISKIKNADLLLQSGYSGFGINLKKDVDKKQLDWLGELEN